MSKGTFSDVSTHIHIVRPGSPVSKKRVYIRCKYEQIGDAQVDHGTRCTTMHQIKLCQSVYRKRGSEQ